MRTHFFPGPQHAVHAMHAKQAKNAKNVFDVLGHFKGVRKPIFRAQMKDMDHMNCAHKFFPGLHHAVHAMHAKHAKNPKNGYFS